MERNHPLDETVNPAAATTLPSPKQATAENGTTPEFKPAWTIWLHPRTTVRQIIAYDPKLNVQFFAGLAGVWSALNSAQMNNSGDTLPLAVIIITACVLGPLGGLVNLWLNSHFICFTGRWIGGTATREHIKTAMAWAAVPMLWALGLWVARILLLGADLFTSSTAEYNVPQILLLPLLTLDVAGLVLLIWSAVLLCHTTAEVQGFRSAWRGLANVTLAFVLLTVISITIGIGLGLLLQLA